MFLELSTGHSPVLCWSVEHPLWQRPLQTSSRPDQHGKTSYKQVSDTWCVLFLLDMVRSHNNGHPFNFNLRGFSLINYHSHSVAKDYLRLLKFGDSLYRCKQLKRAALGKKDIFRCSNLLIYRCELILFDQHAVYKRCIKHPPCSSQPPPGRMCTILKRQNSSLLYLEQVRQHLGRLPSIDPNTRTLLLFG